MDSSPSPIAPLDPNTVLVGGMLVATTTHGTALIVAPTGVIELRPVCRGAWEWVGEAPERRMLVRAALA